MPFADEFSHLVQQNAPLAHFTTWRIGGAAEYYAEPASDAALSALSAAARHAELPIRVFGGGSNLLLPDASIPGLTLRLDKSSAFGCVTVDGERGLVAVGGGVSVPGLVREVAAAGLSGLEPLAGIPGTVGGALAMNAGSASWGIGDTVKSIRGVTPTGDILTLCRSDVTFSYRRGDFGDLIVTHAILELEHGCAGSIQRKVRESIHRKNSLQPTDRKTAGCVFKNPPKASAGRLIDSAGLKNAREGDAVVSPKHANFIENVGGASCADVLRLIKRIRGGVRRTHGIDLELEVRLWCS